MTKLIIVLIAVILLTLLSTNGWTVICVTSGLIFLGVADIATAAVKR